MDKAQKQPAKGFSGLLKWACICHIRLLPVLDWGNKPDALGGQETNLWRLAQYILHDILWGNRYYFRKYFVALYFYSKNYQKLLELPGTLTKLAMVFRKLFPNYFLIHKK